VDDWCWWLDKAREMRKVRLVLRSFIKPTEEYVSVLKLQLRVGSASCSDPESSLRKEATLHFIE
jgi:hypothetical protein